MPRKGLATLYVVVTPADHARLTALVHASGVTVSTLLRDGLNLRLAMHDGTTLEPIPAPCRPPNSYRRKRTASTL